MLLQTTSCVYVCCECLTMKDDGRDIGFELAQEEQLALLCCVDEALWAPRWTPWASHWDGLSTHQFLAPLFCNNNNNTLAEHGEGWRVIVFGDAPPPLCPSSCGQAREAD